MRLRCIGRYESSPRGLTFWPDQEFDTTPEQAAFLNADAPGCFEEVIPVSVQEQEQEQALGQEMPSASTGEQEQGKPDENDGLDQGDENEPDESDEQKALDGPPRDKAVRGPRRK